MRAGGGRSEWTRPSIVLTIISFVMAAGGSYLAVDRKDTSDLQNRINQTEREIAVLKVQVEWLGRRP